ARVRVCVIADGLHIEPLVLELTRRIAGTRVVLVSDATPAAGAAPGRYRMAGVEIESTPAGGARTVRGELAGSVLTLDAATRNLSAMTEAPLAEAVGAASEGPAIAIGRRAGLYADRPADLVLLGDDGAVQRVMRRGRWLG